MGELLALDDVDVSFPGGVHAVDRVGLHVRAGEIVALMGPSGCGKSTVLQVAAGLRAPTSGTVTRHTDRIGYVFQDPTLLPWRTTRRNVELFGELDGLPRTERRARADRVLTAVGLAEFGHVRPARLSGGMRMRVALARALLVEPELFLFDEPFAALDELTRHELGDELLRLFARHGFGALFVTHSAGEAVYLADRVLVMSPRPGRIVGEVAVPFGYPRPPELRSSPEFAALVGSVSQTLVRAS
ncbi:ABC transporter ATP-binding protein [Saccharothrix deserti]|uniref:ABC transporter ATP-binding protein n=1 Tax=Saccharothrix deserti TaxID=2593674 RepID=UPI00131A659B|nr:ABC transporter ATP-binding protein [Saccharothrix deserti]